MSRAGSRSGGRDGAEKLTEKRLERLLQRGGSSRRVSGAAHWPWGAAAEMAMAPGTELLRRARACRGCAWGLDGRCRCGAPLARVCSAQPDPLPGCSPLRRVRASCPRCARQVSFVLFFLSLCFYCEVISVSLRVKPFILDLGTVLDCVQVRVCGVFGS